MPDSNQNARASTVIVLLESVGKALDAKARSARDALRVKPQLPAAPHLQLGGAGDDGHQGATQHSHLRCLRRRQSHGHGPLGGAGGERGRRDGVCSSRCSRARATERNATEGIHMFRSRSKKGRKQYRPRTVDASHGTRRNSRREWCQAADWTSTVAPLKAPSLSPRENSRLSGPW